MPDQGLGFVPYVGDLDIEVARGLRGGAGGGSRIEISDSEPANPATGMLWYDWSAPKLSLRYDHETWLELLPNFETPAGPPAPPPGPGGNGGGGNGGPTPTPPWTMTHAFNGMQVTFQNDPTGRIPLTTWTGWDNDFRQDINDAALYTGPNAPTSPANQKIRLFATFVTQPEVEVDFDSFTLGTAGPNRITIWGYDSGSDSIYIQGANSTGVDIQLRLEKA